MPLRFICVWKKPIFSGAAEVVRAISLQRLRFQL
jgi:hypothetical protein